MLTAEQNERVTRIEPNTPCGKLLRRYWQPVSLVEELPEKRPVKAVRVLGQDFVVFRDQAGRYGMLDRACPHRGADLAFGRLENGGIRCLFHGWLFDVTGQCLEMPAEPANSTFCQRIKQASYPILEKNGVLFGYLGTGTPPAMPRFDCFVAPSEYTFAFKGLMECNWLQALEVGIDPAHASYLHRFESDEDAGQAYGKQFRDTSAGSTISITKVMRESIRPEIQVHQKDYGMQLVSLRRLSSEQTHVRITNLVFPQAFVIPMSSEMTITQWHVPVDDTSCYWYAIFTSFGRPVDKETMRNQRLELYELPAYKARRNKSNNYGYDVDEQRRDTYTGMGHDINVHDNWAVESQGPIQDRTREHLGSTDKAIAAYRRLLIDAIEKTSVGEPVPMVINEAVALTLTGPESIDGIAPSGRWQEYWRECELQRRRGSIWASSQAL
ncbi:MAG: aromatic ring-hydroxylating dioxygenase subunit alpha [Betaproteobacteria bacterium]|nr:MAG: aromatic ring-hydroxylating dioxygenase subunit alpha [Betaproteobacteria bacterium]